MNFLRRLDDLSFLNWFGVTAKILKLLGQAEVGKSNVAIFAKQDVFRLQITIYNLLRVQILNGNNNFRRVKCHLVFSEAPLSLQMEE